MGKRIIHIIFSPFFVALLLASVIIYLLPPVFNNYEVSLYKKEPVVNLQSYDYCDLDGDGNSEKIEINLSYENLVQLMVSSKGKIIDQWNYKGKMVASANPIYGDINSDGIKDVIILTYTEDKILINAISPLTRDILFTNKFLTSYQPLSTETDCGVQLCGFFDINEDGVNEIYFSLSTSFSLLPRGMFAYDPVLDTIYHSNSGYSLIEEPVACDLDNDDRLEFFGNSYAVGNCEVSAKFSDHFSWLMVFDEKMNFEFEPVRIGYYSSKFTATPFYTSGKFNIVLLNLHEGNKDYPSFFAMYDNRGKKIRERKIKLTPEWRNAILYHDESNVENVYLIFENGKIFVVDSLLNYNLITQIYPGYIPRPFSLDIDNDGNKEFIFFSQVHQSIQITRSDFSEPVVFEMEDNSSVDHFNVIMNGEEKPTLYIEGDQYRYYASYFNNPLYYLEYFIYTSIYLAIFLIVWGIQRTQKHRLEQNFEAEKRIASLQLKAIKNQIDPHFTLNIINSIGSLIYKKDKDKADYVFAKYSKLLRSTLLNSERIVATLAEELEYVRTFLDLEKFRYGDKFIYEIKIDENIDQSMKIPRMLIHTFVENSIKHGIKHLDVDGKIEILLQRNGEITTIKIVDNGIGRAKAKELSEFSTGKGLRIVDQIIELYYKLENNKIVYMITDRDEHGTEVLVTLINE